MNEAHTDTPNHALDASALREWLAQSLPDFSGNLTIRQFQGGQSNPTFLLEQDCRRLVLRKRPSGPLAPSAHAIDREYRVLHALTDSGVPAPRPQLYCNDPSIIGTEFYLMECVAGRVFVDPLLPGMAASERWALYDAMNDALARLHQFDWRTAGLEGFGRPDAFFERQIARWKKQYELTRTERIPEMDALLDWLPAHIPEDNVASIVHGDFRIGNLMFHETEPRVVAILDWELSTIGHPIADLAFNCMGYHLSEDDPIARGFLGADIATLGIPNEREYLSAYCRRTGRDPTSIWRFAMAFSLFRTAAIQQGVYARALQGNAASADAILFKDCVRRVAQAGAALIDGGS